MQMKETHIEQIKEALEADLEMHNQKLFDRIENIRAKGHNIHNTFLALVEPIYISELKGWEYIPNVLGYLDDTQIFLGILEALYRIVENED